ncbi:MAG: hypothetical protein JNK57_19240 [Planctomycetaceae bacterium]|nr:hypothetical protein [Planctomycetaceae bacterium]
MNQPLKKYVDVQWTAELDALIGTVPDRVVAERYGIAPRSVHQRRRKLQIKSKAVSRTAAPRWTKKIDKLMGTMHDTDLAKQIGTTKYHVRSRREELGILPYVAPPLPPSEMAPRKKLVLTQTQQRKLGTVPDTQLADQWGCTAGTVTRLRNQLGIAPFIEAKETEWTTGMLNLLGEIPDGTLAREYEVCPVAVKIKRIELGILPYGKKQMDPEPELPAHVIPLIGKMTDKQIADKFKVNRVRIRVYRALHKIPLADYSNPTHHDWTKDEESVLGTKSDGDVARQLNIPPMQVRHRRVVLGIPPFDRKEKVCWSAARVEQLGKMPDQYLARQWGYPQADVRSKRESLGIPPCRHKERPWTKAEIAKLGTMLDTELARELRISQTGVAKKREELGIPPFRSGGPYAWKAKELKRLGQIPDDELAMELGLSYQFVAAKRVELGISARRRSDLRWTKEVIKKMGVISDAQLAAELGCSTGLVKQKRQQLNIPPFTR